MAAAKKRFLLYLTFIYYHSKSRVLQITVSFALV